MGRPISKKLFGNLSYGSPSTAADDGIGGHGVRSVTLGTLGSYTTRPTFTFSAPQLTNGVTAAGTITSEADTGVISGTQTQSYQVGQVITAANGSTWTVATLGAAAGVLASVQTTNTAGAISFSTTGTAMPIGTSINVTGTDTASTLIAPGVYYAKATTATTATLVSSYAAAISGTGGAIVTAVKGAATGLTFTSGTGTGSGAAAAAAPISTVTVLNRGSFTTLTGVNTGAQVTTMTAGGAGALVTVNYRAQGVVITEIGSGYTSAPTATPTQSVTFSAVTLTSTESKVILFSAYVTGGANRTGGDIIKQSGAKTFLVKTSDGTMKCSLKAGTPSAAGEMMITATDSGGHTYYITKLTNKRAYLTQYGGAGWEFATGSMIPWVLTTAVLNVSVLINNG